MLLIATSRVDSAEGWARGVGREGLGRVDERLGRVEKRNFTKVILKQGAKSTPGFESSIRS